MQITPHAKQRFYDRVVKVNLPKKTKDRNKFIEKYVQNAYNYGLTPNEIDDEYLRQYMYSKMRHNPQHVLLTKITHYKNNLFLFSKRRLITILSIPEKAKNSVDDAIYITKIHSFVNHLNEPEYVKKWLHIYGDRVEKTINLKKVICIFPINTNYLYLMNRFPLKAMKYIKNDSFIKKIIVKTNKKRKRNIRNIYYFICALMLIMPKSQIIKFQSSLKNNKDSIFNIICNEKISKKQISICYKQLCILNGGEFSSKYKAFKVKNNIDEILKMNEYCKDNIEEYLQEVRKIFKLKG